MISREDNSLHTEIRKKLQNSENLFFFKSKGSQMKPSRKIAISHKSLNPGGWGGGGLAFSAKDLLILRIILRIIVVIPSLNDFR